MPGSLIPHSKIPDAAIRNIVWGFASGAPKAEVAERAGVTAKAAQSVMLALRERLLEPAFYRWNEPGDLFISRDVPFRDTVERVVFEVLAACYFNKRCFSNYRQGRRTAQLCRSCTVPVLFEDTPTQDRALGFIDTIHDFYTHLGIGGERRKDLSRVVHLRWQHTMMVGRATAASGKMPDGSAAFDDERPGTARVLYETLLASLTREPLRRS